MGAKKQTCRSLERVKSLMRNILQSIPTGVLTLDAREAVTSLNVAGERLLALRASAIVGRAIEDALQAMRGGDSLAVVEELRGRYAEVTVKDTGDGIAEEILPHVFDPYFTTQPNGVGLELAIAHRIVEGHGGTIDVESERGKGTKKTVRLPVGDSRPGLGVGEP
ncbi:MAG TPA: hypothetical protein DCQ64_06190 [Candidatus Rokubacteria bacterium]|nr:MAG: hypothetical protein A2X53_06850 [Candidatus Rokubacteria bacterium GWA2_70_23]OGK91054.1 MAG: hypothetical protein A2X50_04760 [Candidatus Rokubacteria bacterium GWF2_70_14]OGL13580.1 MAG: hypothetical protein A3K12_07890 [Candidatus Rokubacteria bacterium RIFCSPLOWO2_12_FULL_71_19]HAM54999.1 hypothetical protein [Candidatus Rokubacteria bacterium]